MAYTTPDAKLSVTGQRVWRGTDKSNGILMLGDSVPHIETSYSKMELDSDLETLGLPFVPFGNAVWYDDNDIANKQYATIHGSKPSDGGSFAGVMKYEQGVMTGFPMNDKSGYGNGIMPHMKGTLIKRGFVWYKDCFAGATGSTKRDFKDITRNMCLFARNAGGFPVLAVPTSFSNGIPVLANCTYVGSIEQIEPENESVLINIGFNYAVAAPEALTPST